MGMDSEILCVGPFKKGLEKYMPYEGDYSEVPENTIVETTIMHCNTSDTSRMIAECLNVEIGKPETYVLKEKGINWLGLGIANVGTEWEYDDTDGIPALESLFKAGFICIFRPNY